MCSNLHERLKKCTNVLKVESAFLGGSILNLGFKIEWLSQDSNVETLKAL
jgi:hypothetical protein